MRDHLIKARTLETAIRDELLRTVQDDSRKRVLSDLIGIRINTIDQLLADNEAGHPNTNFTEAMDRIRCHFDKAEKPPYKSYRGPTPANEPSLPKDIRTIFEQMAMEGLYHGSLPVLDSKWSPTE